MYIQLERTVKDSIYGEKEQYFINMNKLDTVVITPDRNAVLFKTCFYLSGQENPLTFYLNEKEAEYVLNKIKGIKNDNSNSRD